MICAWKRRTRWIVGIPSRSPTSGGRNWTRCHLSAVSVVSLVDIITVHFMQSTKERPCTSSSKHRSQFPKYENVSSTISLWQSHCAPSLSETKRSESRRSRSRSQHKWGLTTKLPCKATADRTSLATKKSCLAAAVPNFKVRRAWPTQTSSLRLFLGDQSSKNTECPRGATRAKSTANFDY